jgi:hypothetical protein
VFFKFRLWGVWGGQPSSPLGCVPVDHPPPSSDKVKEGVDQHLHSPVPSWRVRSLALPLLTVYSKAYMKMHKGHRGKAPRTQHQSHRVTSRQFQCPGHFTSGSPYTEGPQTHWWSKTSRVKVGDRTDRPVCPLNNQLCGAEPPHFIEPAG